MASRQRLLRADAGRRASGLAAPALRRQDAAVTLASTPVPGVTLGKASPLQVSLLTCRQNAFISDGCCELQQTMCLAL